MVGNLKRNTESNYASLFRDFILDGQSIVILSSDFCHWGRNFSFQPRDRRYKTIWEFVQAMDYEGIDLICSQDPNAFQRYLERTQNTICGRNPISLFLCVIEGMNNTLRTESVFYDMSEWIVDNMSQSSVSYVSMATFTTGGS